MEYQKINTIFKRIKNMETKIQAFNPINQTNI